MEEYRTKNFTMEDYSEEVKTRINPPDQFIYRIDKGIIPFTEQVLREYGKGKKPCEGVVYWSGKRLSDLEVLIDCAVAPRIRARRYHFQVDHHANAAFVDFINDNDRIYISQVHSHPGTFVDHSEVDDNETAFRSEGLVSIVVPVYGRLGMLPLTECGVHRYQQNEFFRLADDYVARHFQINDEHSSLILKDLRND